MRSQAEVIGSIFPAGTISGRSGKEVNGLPAGTQPANCTILLSGNADTSYLPTQTRRNWFLVETEEYLVRLRVCTAMESSGYEEFVVIHDIVDNKSPAAEELKTYCLEAYKSLCNNKLDIDLLSPGPNKDLSNVVHDKVINDLLGTNITGEPLIPLISSKLSQKELDSIKPLHDSKYTMQDYESLKQIFPEGILNARGTEINGLSKNTQPQNCKILLSGEAQLHSLPEDRRTHMLLQTENALIQLRICSAMAGSGYDEYAVYHDIIHNNDPDFEERKAHAIDSITVLSKKGIDINNLESTFSDLSM